MPSEIPAIPHSSPEPDPLPLLQRVVSLIIVLVPFAGLLWAMVLVWGRGFDWLNLGLLVGMYVATGLGVTVGYHRLFTHRAFATNRIVQAMLAVLGSMAVEGSLLHWVSFHRAHHQHSDQDHDPHSPHTHGAGLRNMMRGLWRAHAGWFEVRPGLEPQDSAIPPDRSQASLSASQNAAVGRGRQRPACSHTLE